MTNSLFCATHFSTPTINEQYKEQFDAFLQTFNERCYSSQGKYINAYRCGGLCFHTLNIEGLAITITENGQVDIPDTATTVNMIETAHIEISVNDGVDSACLIQCLLS